MNKLDLSNYVVVTSGNPNYYYELYDKDTMCFVCYYHHKKLEGKPLKRESIKNMRRILTGF